MRRAAFAALALAAGAACAQQVPVPNPYVKEKPAAVRVPDPAPAPAASALPDIRLEAVVGDQRALLRVGQPGVLRWADAAKPFVVAGRSFAVRIAAGQVWLVDAGVPTEVLPAGTSITPAPGK